MNRPLRLPAGVLLAAFVTLARPACAQIYESVGIRAQGLGGAFVAVADDSTATWWNPAGIATGALANAILERGQAFEPGQDQTLGMSIAYPALGLSYFRLRVGSILPGSTGASSQDRQDQTSAGTFPPTSVLSQFGVTVDQSLGDHLAVGATLKLLRADRFHADIDLGGMGRFGDFRLALVLKNASAPELMADGAPLKLDRQLRMGAAWVVQPGRRAGVTLAVDADLTTVATAAGDERHVAGGIELWSAGRRAAIRGGLSGNTVGDARRAASAGASVALRAKLVYFDAQVTRGDDPVKRGWGLAIRTTF